MNIIIKKALRRRLTNIKLGDVYWDCSHHPVLCTEKDGDDIAGVSLIDGFAPRSCSIRHCGATKLTMAQVNFIVGSRELLLRCEHDFYTSPDKTINHYKPFLDLTETSGLWNLEIWE